MKTSKIAAQDRKGLSLDGLQRELTIRGWTIRQSRSEEVTLVATKRNILISDFLAESALPSDREKLRTSAGSKNPLKTTRNQSAAANSHLEDLHSELSKKRWATIVGTHCDHNPLMPLFKSEILRIDIPDSIADLKQEGWSIKIKQNEVKTTIMVLKKKPSLIKRLRNRFK